MGDYLRDRFPLATTDNVYMDGKSGYNLVRFDRPGIIAPVTLTREQADAFCDAVRTARAEAWDEGYRTCDRMWDETADLTTPDEFRTNPRNPYREGGADRG